MAIFLVSVGFVFFFSLLREKNRSAFFFLIFCGLEFARVDAV